MVLAAPAGVRCAVMGGLVAARLARRGAVGAVVGGRVRDVPELPAAWDVWATGVSTVGAGAETKAVAVGVDVDVQGVRVCAGDVVFADSAAGAVVVIPAGLVAKAVGLLGALVEADRKVGIEVERGMGLAEAFKMHRG